MLSKLLGISSAVLLAALAACSSSDSSGATPTADAGPGPGAGNDGGSDAGPGCTPKTGFDSAVDLGTVGTEYAHASMVLGAGDAPMIAFIAYPDDRNAAEVRFVAYDAASCTWKPSVSVATAIGNVTTNAPLRELSLARDAATGELAIAYFKTTSAEDTLELARSTDNGATWTSEQIRTTGHTFNSPVVALGGGTTHLFVWERYSLAAGGSNESDTSAYRYMSRTGSTGAFSDGTLLVSAGINKGGEANPGAVALDSANVPGFVYVSHNDDTQNLEVRFWRPGKDPVKVFDSQGTQNGGASTSLAFDGTKPRIAAWLTRSTDSNGRDLWFAASDDGTTWSAPLQLPQDGHDSGGNYLSLAISGTEMSVASRWGSSDGTHTCGGPKLSTATSLIDWTTCGADTTPASPDSIGFAGEYITMKYLSTGKRVLSFVYQGDAAPLKRGISVWREP